MLKTCLVTAGLALGIAASAAETGQLAYDTLSEPLDHYETAGPALRERAEQDGDPAAYAALVDFLHQRGDWKGGIETVETALAIWPDERRLQALRVELLLLRISNSGIFGMAGAGKALRRACEDDLAHDPENADALLCLARYFAEAPGIAGGSDRKAEEMKERLQAVGGAPWNLLEAQLAGKDRESRIAALRRAVAARPDADIFVNLALNLIADGDHEGARDCLTRALELHPDNRMLLYQLGRLAAESGKAPEEGEAALLRFLSGPSRFGGRDFRAAGHWRLGMIYETTGRHELAREAYRRAASLDPKNDRVRDALAALDRAAAE